MPAQTTTRTPRRKAPSRSRHQDQKLLLALGAVGAILAGWLALAGGAPTTTAAEQVAASTVVNIVPGAPGTLLPGASTRPPAQPRPIVRTRSSR